MRNPIDSFILARLEQEGVRPSAEAEKKAVRAPPAYTWAAAVAAKTSGL